MAPDTWIGQRNTRELHEQRVLGVKSNREYQSTVFTSYFGESANAARLYESMVLLERGWEGGGEPCGLRPGEVVEGAREPIAPEDIVFETLEGVLYLARKNDLAFTVKKKVLVIGEHQSTVNQNMPLRSAIYYGRTMERLVEPRAMYKSKRIEIPIPEFYVFYNGKTPQPLEQTLYLSDSYLEKTEDPMLQLKVKVININLPEGHPLLGLCRPLYEYSWFTWKARECLEGGKSRDEAIEEAMGACVSQGIMMEFFRRHGSEVRNMLFGEFNLEDAREVWEEEAREEGGDYVLVQLVSRKLRKGKGLEDIADELETEVEKIREICKAAEPFAPDYDPDDIFAAARNRAY